ncbi:2-amino-4-hydroxy-6-hydroxymethyldihydropteridine diphosphokinase [Vibrio intestinalis]|uniref:2-amino-4-hydroxy-6- hydroxymethyldihydropteridine diphosphokinase n=1 Tax=Vibrio intestinalis TaxID=2933291 RepID=UPI0021A6F0B2|nr:2-amino-4-hydroxy-6-hydroxymethyldihydropteridine diphosphokinase [Vibrio intestinalis]
MITAYIGIGSNIDREKHVEAALKELEHLGEQLRISTIYECDAVGFDSEPFYNLVAELRTSLSLTDFSQALRNIELKWGRKINAGKFEPRTVDLDLILFGDLVSKQSPQIPRCDIYKYRFVIQPLSELCPDFVVPDDGRTIEQIFKAGSDSQPLAAVKPWFNFSR